MHFRALLTLGRHLNLQMGLSPDRIRELVQLDTVRNEYLFPDGDIESAVSQVVQQIKTLDPNFHLESQLRVMFGTDNDHAEQNYLQLFHLALLPLEDWDHAPAYLYEFAPRGEGTQEILDLYQVATANAAFESEQVSLRT